MRGYCSLNVAGKVFVNRSGRASCLQQCDDFRKQAARAPGRRANDGEGLRIALDDNLRTGADVRHDGGEIAGSFGFRNVDGGHDSDDSANLESQRAGGA
jgi:hypothetical protein